MPAPSTTDEFLALVAKSDLLPAHRLEEFLARRQAEKNLPTEPLKLAQALVFDGLLTKYQAEQLLGGRWRNFIIGGKYKLLERLGKGGMALVFLCEHQVMKRLVALKILPHRPCRGQGASRAVPPGGPSPLAAPPPQHRRGLRRRPRRARSTSW